MILHPDPFLDTEFHVLNSICDITWTEDHFVFKSKRFPGYYDGNKIWVNGIEGNEYKKWIDQFRASFPEKDHHHIRIVVEKNKTVEKSLLKAKRAGFETVERHVFMSANSFKPFPMPPDLIIRELKGKKDWEEFYYHQKACHPDNNWFMTEGLDIQRTTTEKLGIRWFGIFEKHNPKLLASLGVFKYGHMARLQDVKTNPGYFRKGLATHLMHFIIQFALMTLKCEELVLCADRDYHAFDMYQKLGFTPKSHVLVLSKFGH